MTAMRSISLLQAIFGTPAHHQSLALLVPAHSPRHPPRTTMGQLYQRGRIGWVKYYVNGRPVRESTGSEGEREAKRFLRTREGRPAAGMPVLPRVDHVRYEEIAA